MNFNTMLSFETATKKRCVAGSFCLFRICSFSAVARTSEDTRWELMYWAIAGSLVVGLLWCLNLILQVGDFFYHRLSQAPLCWVSTLKYPPNFLSIARFVNFMYQRSWLLLLSFGSIVAQWSLWDTFCFEFLWTSSEDKCTHDVTLQNVHESIYHLGIGLVWYYEVHSPFL
jgi:hypothetical protein